MVEVIDNKQNDYHREHALIISQILSTLQKGMETSLENLKVDFGAERV